MACCKCCCGKRDCEEGDEGKCCCGETCCNAGEYCCNSECQAEPCCDNTPVTYVFSDGGDQEFRACDPQVKETATITIPESVPVPFDADVSWNADDDVEVDGTRLNVTFGSAGGCPYGDYCCASGGAGIMTFSSRSITVKLIDTVGVSWGGSVTIAPICPP